MQGWVPLALFLISHTRFLTDAWKLRLLTRPKSELHTVLELECARKISEPPKMIVALVPDVGADGQDNATEPAGPTFCD